jgi:hypothetical protein
MKKVHKKLIAFLLFPLACFVFVEIFVEDCNSKVVEKKCTWTPTCRVPIHEDPINDSCYKPGCFVGHCVPYDEIE